MDTIGKSGYRAGRQSTKSPRCHLSPSDKLPTRRPSFMRSVDVMHELSYPQGADFKVSVSRGRSQESEPKKRRTNRQVQARAPWRFLMRDE